LRNSSDCKLIKYDGVNDLLNALEAEADKVQNFELTLAFVGVMKSGKSTTINAIAGQELLPSRATPMTSFPAVITHVNGMKEPVLTFEFPQPFNEALQNIKKHTDILGDSNIKIAFEKEDTDIRTAYEMIARGKLDSFGTKYAGTKSICDFLKKINDIVRICSILDIPSPVDYYNKLSQFPRIEVEFMCLRDRGIRTRGKLSLIDTPGPNEAKQTRLKNIVEDQLKKASIVVAVLDYTNLNSEADEYVRSTIETVQETVGNRIFVLVNRFDQRTSNNMNKEETIRFVENKFFQNSNAGNENVKSIRGRIYTTSAKLAFYANLALQEIEENGRLPTVNEKEWVGDYARIAYGETMWEEMLMVEDTAFHKKASQKAWELSALANPLEHVIKKSMENVVPDCLRSALERVNAIVGNTLKSLRLTNEATKKSLGELVKIIGDLGKKLEIIAKLNEEANKLRQESGRRIETLLTRLMNNINELNEKNLARISLTDTIERERAEKDATVNYLRELFSNRKWLINIFSRLFLGGYTGSRENSRLLGIFFKGETIRFDNEEKANVFLENVIQNVGNITNNQFEEILKKIEVDINKEQSILESKIRERVFPVLNQARELLSTEFSYDIVFPAPEFPHLEVDISKISKENFSATQTKETLINYKRMWYTFWLWNRKTESTVTRTYYELDSKSILKELGWEMEEAKSKLEKAVIEYTDKNFDERIESFFSGIDSIISSVKGSIEIGYNGKASAFDEQKVFLSRLEEIIPSAESLLKQNVSVREGFHEKFKGI
jgi:GTPase SAR1 family protein